MCPFGLPELGKGTDHDPVLPHLATTANTKSAALVFMAMVLETGGNL